MSNMASRRGTLLAALVGLLCIGTFAQEECNPLVDAATDAGLTTLLSAVTAADLAETLTAEDASFTIFAPTNDAFEGALTALGISLDDLVSDKELLTEILLHHVVPGSVKAADLEDGMSYETVLGDDSSCGKSDLTVELGDAVVVKGGATEATVQIPDVETCTAVVHVIDFVLLPCDLTEDTKEEPEEEETPIDESDLGDVVEVATEAGLSVLLEAVQAAGLVDAVSAGGLTILAPTDDAFVAALGLLNVTKDELFGNVDLLTQLLTYHVLSEPLTAKDIGRGGVASTLLSADDSPCGVTNVRFIKSEEALTVKGGQTSAQVVTADVKASGENGVTVIHVIDSVLVPCGDDEETGIVRIFFPTFFWYFLHN